MQLFVSYSRKDRKIVDELGSFLRSGGQEVWIDDELRTGEKWRDTLQKAIVDADGIVLAITPNWLASPWCQWEFITAAELNKKVIPVLLTQTDLPERISQYQYANFVEGFNDAARVQRFLDDLLVLAKEIEIETLSDVSKAELENKIDQEIKTGNVSESTIAVRQKAEQAGTIKLGVQLGDVSNSAITIKQETTTIGSQTINQREKQKNWTIPVSIGLLLALISTIAAVLAILPEAQRNELLFGAAPTSTPSRMPANAFNVIVAGFSYRNPDGTLTQNVLADDLSDVVFDSVRELPQIDNLRGWRSVGIGHILESTPGEREAQAALLAEALNADVVIYGVVSSDGLFVVFEPEFYLAAEFAFLEPELVGADVFGDPVEFVGNSDDQITAATDLQRRLRTLRLFIRGLALYITGAFGDAEISFVEAIEETEDDGLEVLHIFAGNAVARIPDYELALQHYNNALQSRPTYARGLLGRGSTLYHMAVSEAGDSPPHFDANLTLDPKQDCQEISAMLPEQAQLLGYFTSYPVRHSSDYFNRDRMTS